MEYQSLMISPQKNPAFFGLSVPPDKPKKLFLLCDLCVWFIVVKFFLENILLEGGNHLRIAPCPILVI
jgi:hypothetical protein